MTEGGAWKKIASGGIREEDMVTFFEDTLQRMKARLLGYMGQVLHQGVDRIGEVGERASEGQLAGVYGAGFTPGCG